jgi:hypothetical protein
MGMRDMHNILMNCGQMIPISGLGPSCNFCRLWRRFLFQSWNYCLNTPCRIHYLHIFCKGNCVAYVNYTPRTAGSNLFRKNVPQQQSTAAMYECTSILMHVNDTPACMPASYYWLYYFPARTGEQTGLEKFPWSTTDDQLPACHRLQHPRRAASNFNNCSRPEPRCRWRRCYLCRKTCEQHCRPPVRN